MQDDISEDMLIILHFMWRKKRFKPDRSFSQKALIQYMGKKVKGDIKKIIKDMVNGHIMAQKQKKGETRNWIDYDMTKIILQNAGYDDVK